MPVEWDAGELSRLARVKERKEIVTILRRVQLRVRGEAESEGGDMDRVETVLATIGEVIKYIEGRNTADEC